MPAPVASRMRPEMALSAQDRATMVKFWLMVLRTCSKSAKLNLSLRVPVLTTECLLAAIPSFLFKLVSELSDKDNLQIKGLRL